MEHYRLLVIDDDEHFVALLEVMLEDVGRSSFELHHRSGFTSGLDALTSQQWDACLVDYRLGAGDGLELLERVDVAALGFPVVLMTGQGGLDVDLLALEAGAADYLPKDGLTGDLVDRCLRYAITASRAAHLLREQAMTDGLTGLANRTRLTEALGRARARGARTGRPCALLFIDLDRFKQINDSVGHGAGDEVLRVVGHRIGEAVRGSDLVARIGGDEFAVLAEDLAEVSDADLLAKKVLASVMRPLRVAEAEFDVRCSIGIAMYPQDTDTPDELLAAADTAMYDAKRNGRNGFRFFSRSQQERAEDLARLEHDLARAIERGELVVHYQPKVTAGSRRPCGAEALLRWQRDGEPVASPAVFIPVAERAGLIQEIGTWVLREAALTARAAAARPGGLAQPVAVNVSMRQLAPTRNFSSTVEAILGETGLAPDLLELEMTESTLASDTDWVSRELGALADLGVTIAIDDFGTGFSSLAYLMDLPVDCLKIDQSFVRRCSSSDRHRAVVQAIGALGHNLGMTVVAEGVETEGEAGYLERGACDRMQGFLFARPMSRADYLRFTTESVATA